MAKLKPTFTLVEMERKLGYNIDSLNYPNDGVMRFYSDLRPVSFSIYERTKREFEEYEKQKTYKQNDTILEKVILMCDVPQTIAQGRDTVTFTRRTQVGFYDFDVDLHYSFGLDLSLLLTKNEVVKAMTVAKLPFVTAGGLGPLFNKLPKELRNKIYTYAFPVFEWTAGDVDSSYELNITGGMRQEALPFAYRRTLFHFDDMDDLVKFLIAIGNVGRDNIESLELAWQSRTDSEYQWAEAPVPNKHSLTLPILHVAKCVQLLKQCKNLRFMQLYFEKDLILDMSPDAYKADPGICELCSVRGIERVEIWDLGYEPLDQRGFVRWLKAAMESPQEVKESGNQSLS